ncbi:hypothetical protein NE237_028012 [Protea cynaroides]|uniref:NADH-ubiquinone oxidoreductase ESSS subunit n=1 Tax=Protea cynaroides TaxID=273540 RepID=A0A9Q0GPG6_9MAGN|nr:hypothetical protein NE237_028012 [Protea cynaroides]
MSFSKGFAAAAGTLRSRLSSSLRKRGAGEDLSRWTSPGHQDRSNGYIFNRTPLPPGHSRKWEDWELPYYITGFLTIVILGVGLNAKPDFTIETWAHKKALERLETGKIALASTVAESKEAGNIQSLMHVELKLLHIDSLTCVRGSILDLRYQPSWLRDRKRDRF